MFVGLATGLSLLLQPSVPNAFLVFYLSAVMLAGWFGRMGAGLLAVFVSMVLVAYFFIAPHRVLAVDVAELPYFLSFFASAVVTSWLGSARRAAEDRQKAHLDELFEQTPEAIMLVDLQDRVLRINKRFSQIFGYATNDALGRRSTELIVPPNLAAEAEQSRRQLASGREVSIETVRYRKDGSALDVSEVSFPVIAAEKPIGFYFILRDITESKRASEKLQKTQAELAHLSRITTMGELAASIAHEINQPIAAMVTNGNAAMRWLSHNPPDLEGAEEALGCIVRDANRAAQVIWRIRSLLAKTPTPMVELNVNDVIREVMALTAFESSRRGASVATELADNLPVVNGDRVQLQQVLLNLIMNSLDSLNSVTDRTRELRIKSSQTEDGVLVQVLDSGRGWEKEHAARIFDPFFTTRKDGIGMGLTISRSIVETHGGRLWAESGKPHGAIMNFILPVGTRPE